MSFSTAPNIGDSYALSIGKPYVAMENNYGMPKKTERSVLDRLVEAMREKGLPTTQVAIAGILGIKQASVSEWKHASPKLEHAAQLAMRLNICVEWIYSERGPKRPGPPAEIAAHKLWDLWGRLDDDMKQRVIGYASGQIEQPESTPVKKFLKRGNGDP